MAVSDQIIQVLDALCEKFGMAIDWTSANIMPYLTTLFTKLVTWEIWTSVASIIFAIVGLAASITLFILAIKRIDDWDIIGVLLACFSFICGFITMCIIGTQIFDIIKCVTFPEMFVFEYVQKLINGG
jgi:hypothetical protein